MGNSLDRYEEYLEDVAPGRRFDLEDFGAWLDLEHTLRMLGSDTWSEEANRDGLQLRWCIGKILHNATPTTPPQVYLDFAEQLNPTDVVYTLNYDLILELALEEVGLRYRRFPSRFSEVDDGGGGVVDNDAERDELMLMKLHGSLDWCFRQQRSQDRFTEADERLGLRQLTEGPRIDDDPLLDIAVVKRGMLDHLYGPSNGHSWYRHPLALMPPSTAKPLSGSAFIPLWDGMRNYSHMRGGFSVIGCSLPRGDPYVLQVVHHMATEYASGRTAGGTSWPQRRMKVVDYQTDEHSRGAFMDRFRFFDPEQTDFFLDGFSVDSLATLFGD